MTAKEKLRQTIEELSEPEAAATLSYIAERRRERDPLAELLDNAPEDDEPTPDEEKDGVREARAEIERGETIALDRARRELA
ncbi:MAG: hypothetical protein H0V55_01845 [Thermoleophilaceae bacterium]|nr:hypothetical protein [Thermoleophilaceae bacterium]